MMYVCLNFGDQHVKNHKLAVRDKCTIVACNLGFLRMDHYKINHCNVLLHQKIIHNEK